MTSNISSMLSLLDVNRVLNNAWISLGSSAIHGSPFWFDLHLIHGMDIDINSDNMAFLVSDDKIISMLYKYLGLSKETY